MDSVVASQVDVSNAAAPSQADGTRSQRATVFPARLVVLMYHGLHRGPQDDGHFDPRYSVTPEAFERQMRHVRQARGRAWLPGDAIDASSSTTPEVMITFDDGEATDATIALPCLQSLGLRAAFFITSGFVGRAGSVTAAQLRQLSDAGMCIGAHGATHRFLSGLSASALRDELRESKYLLEQETGKPVDLLALPGGRGAMRELQTAYAEGYRHVFDSSPGDNRDGGAGGYLQRVAITRDTTLDTFDQILAWHGPAVNAMRWRHRVLRVPKLLIGDARYDRLREALLR